MKTKRAMQIDVNDQLAGIAGLTLMVVGACNKHDGLIHILVRAQLDGMNVNAPAFWKTLEPLQKVAMAK